MALTYQLAKASKLLSHRTIILLAYLLPSFYIIKCIYVAKGRWMGSWCTLYTRTP